MYLANLDQETETHSSHFKEGKRGAYFNSIWELGLENSGREERREGKRGGVLRVWPPSQHLSLSAQVSPSNNPLSLLSFCSLILVASASLKQQHLHDLIQPAILFSSSQFTCVSFYFQFSL